MKTIEKTRLEPSDLVVIDGEVYRADTRIHGKSCKDQCHLVDATGGCRGYCWRWDNADDIVFRHIISATLLSSKAEVCVTPMWREWEEDELKTHNGAQRAYLEKVRTGEPKRRGCKPKGGIEPPKGRRTSWRAQIYIFGERRRQSFDSLAEAEAWLEEMRKEAER
jgi:hypothetical protein